MIIEKMSVDLTYKVICLFYKAVLRDILVDVVTDTKTTFDDTLLELTDKLFAEKEL